jgi:hypothetical protein
MPFDGTRSSSSKTRHMPETPSQAAEFLRGVATLQGDEGIISKITELGDLRLPTLRSRFTGATTFDDLTGLDEAILTSGAGYDTHGPYTHGIQAAGTQSEIGAPCGSARVEDSHSNRDASLSQRRDALLSHFKTRSEWYPGPCSRHTMGALPRGQGLLRVPCPIRCVRRTHPSPLSSPSTARRSPCPQSSAHYPLLPGANPQRGQGRGRRRGQWACASRHHKNRRRGALVAISAGDSAAALGCLGSSTP